MNFKKTSKALDLFAKAFVAKAKKRAPQKDTSGKLRESISYVLNVYENSFNLEFYMEDYGTFVDLGVKGSESTYLESQYSPYKYTKGKFKMINPASLDKWVVRKKLAPRSKDGSRFVDRKSIKYAIATSIYRKGLKASKFYTGSFEEEFKKIDKEIQEAFSLDVNDFLIKTQIV